MFPRIKPPCHDCELRTPDCHSKCDRYKAYAAEVKTVREAENKKHYDQIAASEVRRRMMIKAAKQKRQKPCMKGGSRI